MAALIAGVFNLYFGNGGVQLFCMGLVNLYIFTMMAINWPVLIKS